MNLHRHPELLDRLAAAYALGTLRGGARRRFEHLARRHAAVRAAALLWQERFAAMTEIQPAEAPGPNVWKRIANEIAAQRSPAMRSAPARAAGNGWRIGALAGVAATVACIAGSLFLLGGARQREAMLTAKLQAQPEVRYVAVLIDQKSAESMLVTFDPDRGAMVVKRVGGFQEPADKSLQLWALPQAGSPRSLGVLGGGSVQRLATARDQMRAVPALAVSLEPRGGVRGDGGPTGPVLFKGALLQAP